MPGQSAQNGGYTKKQWDVFGWMILQEGPWTQTELCEATGRSPQSTYWLIKKLVRAGEVIKLNSGHAHRGRPNLYECILRRKIICQMCDDCIIKDLKELSA